MGLEEDMGGVSLARSPSRIPPLQSGMLTYFIEWGKLVMGGVVLKLLGGGELLGREATARRRSAAGQPP